MTNEQTMDSSFDYNEWRKQGQAALESLQSRKDALAAELEDVIAQIKEVRKTVGAAKVGPQRFRIKPLITNAITGKASVSVDELVSSILSQKEGATEAQVVAALDRYVSEFENVTIEDGVVYVK